MFWRKYLWQWWMFNFFHRSNIWQRLFPFGLPKSTHGKTFHVHFWLYQYRKPPCLLIVTSLPFWAMMLTSFCNAFWFYVFFSTLPIYMQQILRFSNTEVRYSLETNFLVSPGDTKAQTLFIPQLKSIYRTNFCDVGATISICTFWVKL